jgi:hypothetical protein
MTQVENGSPEVYGSWARANPDCLRWSKVRQSSRAPAMSNMPQSFVGVLMSRSAFLFSFVVSSMHGIPDEQQHFSMRCLRDLSVRNPRGEQICSRSHCALTEHRMHHQTTATPVLILQLCMSVVSICQVIFMISRAPKVPWEAIYLPLTEAVTYALAYTDHGTFRLASGKLFPWSRMGSWVCT